MSNSSISSDLSIVESSFREMDAHSPINSFVGFSTLVGSDESGDDPSINPSLNSEEVNNSSHDESGDDSSDYSIKDSFEAPKKAVNNSSNDESGDDSSDYSIKDSFEAPKKAVNAAYSSDDSFNVPKKTANAGSSKFTKNIRRRIVSLSDSDSYMENDFTPSKLTASSECATTRVSDEDEDGEVLEVDGEDENSYEDDENREGDNSDERDEIRQYENSVGENREVQEKEESMTSGSKNDDSVVCLDDDCGASPTRLVEVRMERRKLELELNQVNAEIKKLQASLENVDPESLPDGGERIKIAIKRKVGIRNILVGRIKEFDSQLGKMPREKETLFRNSSPLTESTTNAIIPPKHLNVDIEGMGKRALATYETQQSVTVDSLKKLQSSLEMCPDETMSTDDPVGLRVKLLPHQNVALTWLLWREKQKPSGGVLADDMGLGKTLTMLALILKSKQLAKENDSESSESDENDLPSSGVEGGTLVVCPASVMGQWEGEIKTRIKNNLLTYCVHHGNRREVNPKRLKKFDVVITTYTVVQKEQSKTNALFGIKWNRIILDESHVIRNHKSLTSLAIFELKGKTRWCLTGTPIHNKALDFYAVIKFIKVTPFNDLALWKKWVDNRESTGLQRLAVINKTLMLRRTKDDIQKKGGLKGLQEKKFVNITVRLDKDESDLYEKVAHFSKTVLAQFLHQRAEKAHLFTHGVPINRANQHFAQLAKDDPFKEHPELERLFKNLSSMKDIKTHQILVLLLRLRQICCHPQLAVDVLDKVELTEEGINDEDGIDIDLLGNMQKMSLNAKDSSSDDDAGAGAMPCVLSPNHPVFKRDRLSSKVKAMLEIITEITTTTDDKIVVVSQWTSMLDVLNGVLKNMGIKCLNLNGSIPVPKRAPIIEEFNSKSLERKVLLLSLTSGGVGLNLIGGNHLLLADLHWNPQLEAQAQDRVYRVGQTKPVHIYKFICIDTIEERISKLQEHKLEIAKDVMSGSRSASSSKLTIDEIKSLFSL